MTHAEISRGRRKVGSDPGPRRGTEGCEQSRGILDTGQGRTTTSCPQQDPCVGQDCGSQAPGQGYDPWSGLCREAGTQRYWSRALKFDSLGTSPTCPVDWLGDLE